MEESVYLKEKPEDPFQSCTRNPPNQYLSRETMLLGSTLRPERKALSKYRDLGVGNAISPSEVQTEYLLGSGEPRAYQVTK